MLATDVISAARTWRPAEYGDKRAADIPDALVEPLWTGPRVLALVANGEASLTDAGGGPIEGREDILAELVEAVAGATVLIEGVLTPEPLQATSDVAARDVIPMPNAGQMASQMIVGDRAGRKGQLEDRLQDVRRRMADDTAVEVALVAVDLLWIDDQSICDVPLLERKRVLESAITESRLVRIGIYVRPPIDPWIGSWRTMGFRRMSFRAANSRYVPSAKNQGWAQAEIPRR
ncbi:MAG TPA: hypothetical protein VIK65_13055 [Candidatus Limnocylindrales bacterium]|jgi:hypothetical protein